ncbi:MAG: DUF4835 family protein [Bacteroidota bacterium]
MKLPIYLIASVLLLLVSGDICRAQELNCSVIVNAEFAQSSEKGVFKSMEASLASFLNETRWTDDTFKPEERIKCNFIITIQEIPNIGTYSATVQIVSARPIHNTDYESVVFNFADRDWEFEFAEAQNIIFDQNTFTTNLAALLAYYANIIIGYDYDSFEKSAGDEYFEKAWLIVQNSQRSGFKGWDQFSDNRNRYWLAENLISPQLTALRELHYAYYREGLDIMTSQPEETRKKIADTMKGLEAANRIRPRAIATIAFIDAKEEELINIFSEGDLNIRRSVYNTLSKIDPSKTDRYKPIVDN